jgi:hypothetical protein
MKNLGLFFIASACLFGLASCECDKVDCQNGDNQRIVFLSKTDSTDLILTGQYDLDSVSILPLLLDESKPSGEIGFKRFENSLDYVVSIEANANTVGYVIQLDSLPADTLSVTFGQREESKCCPGFLDFATLELNGELIPLDLQLQTIKIFK